MINFGVTERKRQELERRTHNCNLLENDIEEKFVRSSGAGGQKKAAARPRKSVKVRKVRKVRKGCRR